jgi:hypothetical protein
MGDAPTITAERFKLATGREPERDDLERCNCERAGEIGHWACGWDTEHDLPMFMTLGRRVIDGLR